MKNKININLNDVVKLTTKRKESKKPDKKSSNYIEWMCRRNGLLFSFKQSGINRDKLTFTYKHILNKINHNYDILEQIIKHYFTVSKLYQYYHPEHHAMYFNLFFVKDHLQLFLESIDIINSYNHNVDWMTLKYALDLEGEEYEELDGYEEALYRKRRADGKQ